MALDLRFSMYHNNVFKACMSCILELDGGGGGGEGVAIHCIKMGQYNRE